MARASSVGVAPVSKARHIVLAGNPNSGKTTLFNALTGLRAKVGNYPGVTVERKEGRLLGSTAKDPVVVLDLPGTYSLSPQSLDEQVARDVLLHRLPEVPPPDVVVVVVDASNLQRNLYFTSQVIELGYPTVVALNMVDVAENNGHAIDAAALAGQLGVPVVPLIASQGQGVPELRRQLLEFGIAPRDDAHGASDKNANSGLNLKPRTTCLVCAELPPAFDRELSELTVLLGKAFPGQRHAARAEALLLLSDEKALERSQGHYPEAIRTVVGPARARLEKADIDWRSAAIEARYRRIAEIQETVTRETLVNQATLSDRLDRLLTHKFWGLIIFVGIMALMFQSIFSFAELPMNGLEHGVDWVGKRVSSGLGPGALNDLLVNGVIKGVGAVVVFLPQICLLFFFIGLLEDTGYMARAAFLMDRLMSRVGLHGKSFIPMLSSFACAIPGIMATRTIESPKDRLVTILVAPLMSCSARLPVYTLLIAACIPDERVLGFLRLRGMTMLSMYLLGIVVALFMAWLFKKTLLKGPTPMLIMELPPYKRPLVRIVLRHMWDRAWMFVRRAGTVILGINILLWFLASYPKNAEVEKSFAARRAGVEASAAGEATKREQQLAALEKEEAGARLRQSFAGRVGRLIEPALRPLGFDWKIGIGIVSSFAAREVFVSTMSLVYNVGEVKDSDEAVQTLSQTLREQQRPDGTPVYTRLVAITLMVFYVFALQCVSTIAVVRRETGGWKWPVFQWLYMGALAWVLAWVCYQGGRLLGWN
jgi:ferrous iron transport protein B